MNNPPAFPQHGWSSDPKTIERMKTQGGMTLRDYFAAQAIGPLMASDGFEASCMSDPEFQLERDLPAFCAEEAYRIADAMLLAREKKTEGFENTSASFCCGGES